jgi:hypothetical protein
MKHILFCLFLLLPGISFYASAQNSFIKQAPGLSADRFMPWKDGNYLLCGTSSTINKDSIEEFRLQFSVFDTLGNLLRTKQIYVDTFQNDTFYRIMNGFNSQAFCLFNNHLIAGGSIDQLNGNTACVLMQLNDSFDTRVRTVKVEPGKGVVLIHRILATSANELIVFGDYQEASGKVIKSFLSAYDSTLQLKWQRNFNITYGSALADHIIAIPGGFIIALEYQFDFSGGTPSSFTGDIIFLDAIGNKKRSIPLIDNKRSVNNIKLAATDDGLYMAAWNDDYIPDTLNTNNKSIENEHASVWFTKFNYNGIFWSRGLTDYIAANVGNFESVYIYNTDMIKTSDGGLVVCGSFVSYPFYPLAFTIKVDDAAKVKWFKSYNFFNPDHDSLAVGDQVFNSLAETKDKGLIVAGSFAKPYSDIFPNGVQTALAVKLKEDGCVEDYCGLYTGINPYINTSKNALTAITIFPNPAQNQITINLPIANSFYEYSIFNTLSYVVAGGRQSSPTINIAELQSGIYYIKISSAQNPNLQYYARFIKL